MQWLNLISRNRGTISYSPSFGYDLSTRRGAAQIPADLDLSCWRRAGIGGDRELTYAEINGRVYWSNGRLIRAIDNSTTDAPAWPVFTGGPRVTRSAGIGGLDAGIYQVAVTYIDTVGRESNSSLAEVLELQQGDGITVDQLAPNDEAQSIRIYVSQAGGETLRLADTVPVGTISWLIGNGPRGRALETQWHVPLPPGRFLRQQNARLFVADGHVLRYSDGFRYGLAQPDGHWGRYGDPIDLLEPIGEADASGMFVASGKRTRYLSGPDPKQWREKIVYGYGAVPGTGRQFPASAFGFEGLGTGMVPVWMARNGVFVVGMPGGAIRPIAEDRVALDEYEAGALMLRRQNGISQIVAALRGPIVSNSFRATDSAAATVRRYGTSTSYASSAVGFTAEATATVNA